ncbi:Band 7 protein domain containing protein [Aphelenchoides besseyi]|nr:Band 7 protein domain containing protein [Aphelenchoides besseyi]
MRRQSSCPPADFDSSASFRLRPQSSITARRRERFMKRRTQTITSDNTPTESFEEPLVTSQRSPAAHSVHAHFFDYGLGTPPPPSNVFLTPSMEAGHLRPPTVFEAGLTRLEPKPHRRDTLEKIPIRARSQSWLIRTRHLLDEDKNHRTPIISHCLEYERGVVFRLGRLLKSGTKGPGIFFIIPCLDVVKIVDLRVLSFDVPSQEILSRDSVTVSVEAVIYFRVSNPVISVTNVSDAQFSTKLLAQTTLRNVLGKEIKSNSFLGTKTLSEILMERDSIASITEKVLDDGTVPWGVKVQRVEIKDIRLPHMLMRSMAAEAEAARGAQAKISSI